MRTYTNQRGEGKLFSVDLVDEQGASAPALTLPPTAITRPPAHCHRHTTRPHTSPHHPPTHFPTPPASSPPPTHFKTRHHLPTTNTLAFLTVQARFAGRRSTRRRTSCTVCSPLARCAAPADTFAAYNHECNDAHSYTPPCARHTLPLVIHFPKHTPYDTPPFTSHTLPQTLTLSSTPHTHTHSYKTRQ